MKLILAVVGKPRDTHLAAVIRDYETRATRYWPLAVREVREEPSRGLSAPVVRDREGTRLLSAAGAAQIVACDERGDAMTSRDFANWMQDERERARDLALVIGGAYGLSAAVRERAARLIRLAPWTLPHELARLVIAEQLYRAGTILRREPYHK